MDVLWRRFSGLYGFTFASQYGDDPTIEWEMACNGLEPQEIKAGLEKMVSSGNYKKFPPNPIEFRALCMPCGEDYGLPDDDEAYSQATRWGQLRGGDPKRQHPAVLKFLQDVGQCDFHEMRSKESRAKFNERWPNVVRYVASGGELPDIHLQIEDNTPSDKKTASSHLDALKKSMGI